MKKELTKELTYEQAEDIKYWLRYKSEPKGSATMKNLFKHLPEVKDTDWSTWKRYGLKIYPYNLNGKKVWNVKDKDYGTSIYDY